METPRYAERADARFYALAAAGPLVYALTGIRPAQGAPARLRVWPRADLDPAALGELVLSPYRPAPPPPWLDAALLARAARLASELRARGARAGAGNVLLLPRSRPPSPDELVARWPRGFCRAQHTPILLVTGGLPGAGKSHFARELCSLVAMAHVGSDEVRRALTAGAPTYTSEESALVHATTRRIMGAVLADRRHVVLDTTALVPSERAVAIAAGRAAGARVLLLWFEAPDALAAERLAARARGDDPADASGADLAVRARMAGRVVAPTRAEADALIVVTPETRDERLRELIAICRETAPFEA